MPPSAGTAVQPGEPPSRLQKARQAPAVPMEKQPKPFWQSSALVQAAPAPPGPAVKQVFPVLDG